MFFKVECVSWKLKCWILLMHGITMKFIESTLSVRHKTNSMLPKYSKHFHETQDTLGNGDS